jgi:hypothetical protein
MKRIRPRLSYANVVSTLCLFVLLGGGAYAASKLPKNSVGTKQLKRNAVKGAKVANRSLTAADIRGPVDRALSAAQADRATGADRATVAGRAESADLLGGSPAAAFLPSGAVARAHSEVTIAGGGRIDPLLTMGPLKLEANCENSGLDIFVRILASTSASGGRAVWGSSGGSTGGIGLTSTPQTTVEQSAPIAADASGAGDLLYIDPTTTISLDFAYTASGPGQSCTIDAVALRA